MSWAREVEATTTQKRTRRKASRKIAINACFSPSHFCCCIYVAACFQILQNAVLIQQFLFFLFVLFFVEWNCNELSDNCNDWSIEAMQNMTQYHNNYYT
jgi:hypothetical protein